MSATFKLISLNTFIRPLFFPFTETSIYTEFSSHYTTVILLISQTGDNTPLWSKCQVIKETSKILCSLGSTFRSHFMEQIKKFRCFADEACRWGPGIHVLDMMQFLSIWQMLLLEDKIALGTGGLWHIKTYNI